MQPSRRSALAVAVVLMLGVAAIALVVLASAGGSVRPYSESTATAAPPREIPTRTPAAGTPPVQGSPPVRKDVKPFETPAWVTFVWQALFYTVIALLVLLLLRALYRMVNQVELPTVERSDSDWERVKAERLADAVEEGLAAIDSGTASDGVIACWVALEDAAASAGAARQASETTAEFTVRVLGVGSVSEPELLRLAQLYREARYSTHGSSEEARSQARAALVRLREELTAAIARRTPTQLEDQPEDEVTTS